MALDSSPHASAANLSTAQRIEWHWTPRRMPALLTESTLHSRLHVLCFSHELCNSMRTRATFKKAVCSSPVTGARTQPADPDPGTLDVTSLCPRAKAVPH